MGRSLDRAALWTAHTTTTEPSSQSVRWGHPFLSFRGPYTLDAK